MMTQQPKKKMDNCIKQSQELKAIGKVVFLLSHNWIQLQERSLEELIMEEQGYMVILKDQALGRRRKALQLPWVKKKKRSLQGLMMQLLKIENTRNFMVLTLLDHKDQPKRLLLHHHQDNQIIESQERLLNCNPMSSLMLMIVSEQNETRPLIWLDNPRAILVQLKVDGLHKIILPKQKIKEESIHIHKSKTNWEVQYWPRLIIQVLLHYKKEELIWITSRLSQIQEDK